MPLPRASVLALALLAVTAGCGAQAGPDSASAASHASRRTGVLLASHGSRSPQWRAMLNGLEDAVRDRLQADLHIDGVKTAFMEYTEPSIATRMKEFDAEGYTDVVVVPVFLTVSSHSFDDIPTILYLKDDATSKKVLESEDIERYRPKARVTLAPELDFPGFLENNIRRRVAALGKAPSSAGVALIAYGSSAYNKEWEELMLAVGTALSLDPGIDLTTWGWCGHIVSYTGESTQQAIRAVLAEKDEALVIPVLVAYDEMFQTEIIGGAIQGLDEAEQQRVRYRPDAILPDRELEDWVVTVATTTASELASAEDAQPRKTTALADRAADQQLLALASDP